MNPKWLEWVQRLQAIAQNGLTFAKDPFDIERYEQIRKLAAEIGESYTDVPDDRILGLFRAEYGYATPKVDGRGVVFKDERILLVRERSDGLWTLPGGWVDIGESPSEAIVREVCEESGYETRAAKLVALYDRNKHEHPPLPVQIYKIFIECELIGGDPIKANIEIDGVDFFDEHDLPDLSVTRITERQIHRLFELHRNPDLPVDFD